MRLNSTSSKDYSNMFVSQASQKHNAHGSPFLGCACKSVRGRKGDPLRFQCYNRAGCCGWVPCFLVSRPLRSRDGFFCCTKVTEYIILERFTRSNDVLTLDNVYISLFVRIGLYCPTYIYILVCTDWFVLSK